MTAEPLECVAALILDEGTLLAEERALTKKVMPGAIALPGGHVEPGEKIEDALRRELEEELGIVPLDARYVCTLLHRSKEIRKLHYFAVTRWEGVIGSHEAASLRWLPLDAPHGLDLDVDRLPSVNTSGCTRGPEGLRDPVRCFASFCLLALVVTGCASTKFEASGRPPVQCLCQSSGERVSAIVLWGPRWRPDQKDIPLREAAAQRGIERFFASSGCYASAQVLRTIDDRPAIELSAADVRALAAAQPSAPSRAVFIAVRELGLRRAADCSPVIVIDSDRMEADGPGERDLHGRSRPSWRRDGDRRPHGSLPGREGRGRPLRAEYDDEEQSILLLGDAKVWFDGSVVIGEKITVFLDEDGRRGQPARCPGGQAMAPHRVTT